MTIMTQTPSTATLAEGIIAAAEQDGEAAHAALEAEQQARREEEINTAVWRATAAFETYIGVHLDMEESLVWCAFASGSPSAELEWRGERSHPAGAVAHLGGGEWIEYIDAPGGQWTLQVCGPCRGCGGMRYGEAVGLSEAALSLLALDQPCTGECVLGEKLVAWQAVNASAAQLLADAPFLPGSVAPQDVHAVAELLAANLPLVGTVHAVKLAAAGAGLNVTVDTVMDQPPECAERPSELWAATLGLEPEQAEALPGADENSEYLDHELKRLLSTATGRVRVTVRGRELI